MYEVLEFLFYLVLGLSAIGLVFYLTEVSEQKSNHSYQKSRNQIVMSKSKHIA